MASPKNSDFVNALVRTSQDAQARGWPGNLNIDPIKTVGDTFNSILGGARDVVAGGFSGAAQGIGDFSAMGQANIGAAQAGLQGLGHSAFGAQPAKVYKPPSNFSGSSAFSVPGLANPKPTRKSKKASK